MMPGKTKLIEEFVKIGEPIDLSVIIPIHERGTELRDINDDYLRAIDALGTTYEVIYVLDQQHDETDRFLMDTVAANRHCKRIRLSRCFGDSTAFSVGIRESVGSRILVLPPYAQVDPDDLSKVIDGLSAYDVVIAVRDRGSDSKFNRVKSAVFNFMARRVADLGIDDLTCDVRAFKRSVAEEVTLYGGLHRFLPQQANRLGFSVGGVQVAQAAADRSPKFFGIRPYVRRVLDVIAALFLLRFTMKPLRFFGIIGLMVGAFGAALLCYVIFQRLFGGVALADRPLLFLSSLAIVLGLHILAIGLVGEIVVFGRAKEMPEYRIREIIEADGAGAHRQSRELPDPPDPEEVSGAGQ